MLLVVGNHAYVEREGFECSVAFIWRVVSDSIYPVNIFLQYLVVGPGYLYFIQSIVEEAESHRCAIWQVRFHFRNFQDMCTDGWISN